MNTSYVLIVDDDPDARDLLALVINNLDLKFQTASNGVEALKLIADAPTHPPVLILLDLMMPMLDGFSTYNRLQGHPQTRYIPVIVVSALRDYQIDMLMLPGVKHVCQKGKFTLVSMQGLIADTLALQN